MWKKVTLGVVLVTLFGLQWVNSLNCYTCNSPQSCRNPSTLTCSDSTANATSIWLNQIHSNVPVIRHSEKFRCMNLSYAINTNNVITHEYLGCYHSDINVCNLNLNITYSTKKTFCKNCDTNLCNRNPAGTFSRSIYTIIGSITALLVAARSI